MPQITVTVVRADTNQEYEVELPDDAKLDDLLPQLVQQLGLPLVGPDGNRISYQLSNKRTSQELKQNKTLGEYATKHGDLLLLTSTFVAGN
jgi:WXG100 protein secretion system (Wss), protein YukD